jgi:hypothetical protein
MPGLTMRGAFAEFEGVEPRNNKVISRILTQAPEALGPKAHNFITA